MFVVTMDTSGPLATIGAMIAQIDHFKRVGIGQELSAWQTEDMDRHKPFTMRSRAKGQAATVIRPHSLAEVLRSQGIQERITGVRKSGHGWKLRARKLKIQLRRHWSTRPILRSELYAILEQRMNAALREKLQWKKGGAK
jgi:hypothetical protein